MSMGRVSLGLLAGLLVVGGAAVPEPAPPDPPAAADCSFSHPQLPGRCRVTIEVPRHATARQTCESVLRCINGSVCADAQKYCPNPGVAKTWKLEEASDARPRVECAFSNPGYSGWCRLTAPVPRGAAPRESCEAVLTCMNGSPCEGFVYHCQPDILTGWRVAEVRPVTALPAPKW